MVANFGHTLLEKVCMCTYDLSCVKESVFIHWEDSLVMDDSISMESITTEMERSRIKDLLSDVYIPYTWQRGVIQMAWLCKLLEVHRSASSKSLSFTTSTCSPLHYIDSYLWTIIIIIVYYSISNIQIISDHVSHAHTH